MAQKLETLGTLVTINGAAKELGINREALYKRIYRHQIPTYRIGRVILVRLEDVERSSKFGISSK